MIIRLLEYYKIAADQGHSTAQFQVGYCYFYDYGCDKDEDKRLKLMEEKSTDDGIELFTLGEVYHLAGPKHQNFPKALEYYQKTFTGNQQDYSLRDIGLLYDHGDGVVQNYQAALTYYQKAANEQNKGGYYNIALVYYNGHGVDKDYDKAVYQATYISVMNEKWYPNTANSKIRKVYSLESESFMYGEVDYYLATMFKNGRGTAIDQDKAAEHLETSISYGSVKAREFK
ncbi:HCP-like protein [Backusella circina FSU 941]|nr:HCP-like protein [Backusella circina FSU 941]